MTEYLIIGSVLKASVNTNQNQSLLLKQQGTQALLQTSPPPDRRTGEPRFSQNAANRPHRSRRLIRQNPTSAILMSPAPLVPSSSSNFQPLLSSSVLLRENQKSRPKVLSSFNRATFEVPVPHCGTTPDPATGLSPRPRSRRSFFATEHFQPQSQEAAASPQLMGFTQPSLLRKKYSALEISVSRRK